jgi:hypothetical protein
MESLKIYNKLNDNKKEFLKNIIRTRKEPAEEITFLYFLLDDITDDKNMINDKLKKLNIYYDTLNKKSMNKNDKLKKLYYLKKK